MTSRDVDRRTVASADGVRLAVVEVGPPTAPPVGVAHGGGSASRVVVAAFAGPVTAAGARLIAFDQRGHGDSDPVHDPAGHALDRHVDDLVAVVDHLDPHEEPPVAVVGVSMGGHAAVRAAASGRLPDVATVVACLPAWTGRAAAGEGPHAAIAAEVRTTGIAAMTDRLAADTVLPSWLRDTLVTDYRRHDPDSLTAALLALDGGEAPTLDEAAAVAPRLGVVAWPDDPGHPLAVATAWGAAAGTAPVTLHLDDLDAGVDRLGAAAMRAIAGDGRPTGSAPALGQDRFGGA